MTGERQKIVVITGPTASGKSSLAVKMAHHFQGEIINADSMQVYRGMDVGTAKPSTMERGGIPHHLIDVVDPDDDFNAAIYRSLTLPLLKDIAKRGKLCFLVGGTGLYIKVLVDGILECPPADPGVREEIAREYEEQGGKLLHARLMAFDHESAVRIHPNDKIRITRALEIIKLTGQPLSSLIRRHNFKERNFQVLKICLEMDREQLYRRINERSIAMIKNGLVEETERLLEKGYSPDLKSMKSLGYRHVIRFIEREWDLDETVMQLQKETRRYAKRQLTWFRADPEMLWIKTHEMEGMAKKIEIFNNGGRD